MAGIAILSSLKASARWPGETYAVNFVTPFSDVSITRDFIFGILPST
jgi:hypothetical protein